MPTEVPGVQQENTGDTQANISTSSSTQEITPPVTTAGYVAGQVVPEMEVPRWMLLPKEAIYTTLLKEVMPSLLTIISTIDSSKATIAHRNLIKEEIDKIQTSCINQEKQMAFLQASYLKMAHQVDEVNSDLAEKSLNDYLRMFLENRDKQANQDNINTPDKSPPKAKEQEHVITITTDVNTAEDSEEIPWTEVVRRKAKTRGITNVKDLIITKDKRVIIKTHTRDEAVSMHEALKEDADLQRANRNIKINKENRNRLIIFGIPNDLTEDQIKNELISKQQNISLDLIKKFEDKNKQTNLIIDTNDATKDLFLSTGRLSIDCVICRIQPYKSITRCFKCQDFGHTTTRCTRRQICSKCGNNHHKSECKETTLRCVNCTKSGDNNEHSADSRDCPALNTYRRKVFGKP